MDGPIFSKVENQVSTTRKTEESFKNVSRLLADGMIKMKPDNAQRYFFLTLSEF